MANRALPRLETPPVQVHTLTDRGLQVVASLRLEQLAIRRMGAQALDLHTSLNPKP